MFNIIKYHINKLKIKWYEYWLDDSAGLPDLIEDYSATIKSIAEATKPLVKRSSKKTKILDNIIDDAEKSFASSEY